MDRLRATLAHRGVTSPAAGLSLVLANQAAGAAPAGMAASISSSALASGAGALVPVAAWIHFMSTSKLVIGSSVATVALVVGAVNHEWTAAEHSPDTSAVKSDVDAPSSTVIPPSSTVPPAAELTLLPTTKAPPVQRAGIRVPAEFYQITRSRKEAEVREKYVGFIQKMGLSDEVADLLVKIVADDDLRAFEAPMAISGRDALAPTYEELVAFRQRNRELLTELLGGENGYGLFASYTKDFENAATLVQSFAELQSHGLSAADDRRAALAPVILHVNASGGVGNAVIDGKPWTAENIAALRAQEAARLTTYLAEHGGGLTHHEAEAIKRWAADKIDRQISFMKGLSSTPQRP